MPKEYPLKDGKNKIVDVCECGHTEFYHGFDKRCLSCACPKYKFEQQLRSEDADELSYRLYRKAKDDNYVV